MCLAEADRREFLGCWGPQIPRPAVPVGAVGKIERWGCAPETRWAIGLRSGGETNLAIALLSKAG